LPNAAFHVASYVLAIKQSGLTNDTALLALERRSYDGDGHLVDLLNVQYRPDQFTYQMTLDVDADTSL
jgi:DNA-binding GntR family transcriptional regulator